MKKLTAWLIVGMFCCLTASALNAAEEASDDASPRIAPAQVKLEYVPAGNSSAEPQSLPGADSCPPGVNSCLPSPISSLTARPAAENDIPALKAPSAAAVVPVCQGNSSASSAASSAGKAKMTAQSNPKNIGTKHNSPPPAAGVGKKIKVKAYAYCIHGRTASGTRTSLGTIAVDPSRIPLGSKVYIPGYGWGTALDTGGSMRGNVIDIWYPSSAECYRWGARDVTITVLPR